MSDYFTITEGTDAERRHIATFLPHLDRVSAGIAEKIITAWVTVWKSSTHERPEDFPYTLLAPSYRLMDHVAEVTELGVMLAEYREQRWKETFDPAVLVPTLILHDVDKPLQYEVCDGVAGYSRLGKDVPHGVLGGFLLHALGFDERVVSIVSTHASNSPFHSSRDEGWILHYADFYSLRPRASHARRARRHPLLPAPPRVIEWRRRAVAYYRRRSHAELRRSQ